MDKAWSSPHPCFASQTAPGHVSTSSSFCLLPRSYSSVRIPDRCNEQKKRACRLLRYGTSIADLVASCKVGPWVPRMYLKFKNPKRQGSFDGQRESRTPACPAVSQQVLSRPRRIRADRTGWHAKNGCAYERKVVGASAGGGAMTNHVRTEKNMCLLRGMGRGGRNETVGTRSTRNCKQKWETLSAEREFGAESAMATANMRNRNTTTTSRVNGLPRIGGTVGCVEHTTRKIRSVITT